MKNLILVFLLMIIIVSGCISQQEEKTIESAELNDFAQCLKEQGVIMYGSVRCSICERQKKLFGSSFQYVEEIECHPQGENPQTELCLKMDIAKTPTWILEKDGVEIKRLGGYQDLEALSELSGCQLEVRTNG